MTTGAGKPSAKTRKQENELRAFALSFPGAHEDRPWGHAAFKVKNKTFLFMSADSRGLGLSVKLIASNLSALDLPYTEPTHYGLGKHGWVSASFGPGDEVPMRKLEEWIQESYRAIAPKTILKQLDLAASSGSNAAGRPAGEEPRPTGKPARRAATSKKATGAKRSGKKATGK